MAPRVKLVSPRSSTPRSLALAVSVVTGCSQAPPPACPAPTGVPTASAAPAVSSASATSPAAVESPADVEIACDLALEPAPAARVSLRLRRGAWARELRLARGARSSLASLSATDAQGPLALRIDERDGGLVATPERPPADGCVVAYALTLGERPDGDLGSSIDPNRAVLLAESFLFVPALAPDDRAAVSVVVRPAASHGDAVSTSLGWGARHRVEARGVDLASLAVLTGELGRAWFVSYEGTDEASWSGVTPFDARWVSTDLATTRTSIDAFFGGRGGPPYRMMLVAESRPEAPLSLTPRPSGLVLRVDARAPWGATSRLRVATEFARRWLGRRVRVDDPLAAPLVTEGFSRAIARDVLFAAGSLAPAELGDEANALLAEQALSRHHGRGAAAVLGAPLDAEGAAYLTARGALHATRLDRVIRDRSKNTRSLRELVRSLVRAADAAGGKPLGREALSAAIAAEAGEAERGGLDALVQGGADVVLSGASMGNCFRMETLRFEPFELGFTEALGPDGGRVVTGVTAGSAAARAGLRVGDRVVASRLQPGRARVPVHLELTRGGAPLAIDYTPAGKPVPVRGFVRDRKVADDACNR